MARFDDGTFTTATQIGYEFELIYPGRGNHGNYLHHQDFCIDRDSYVPDSLDNIVKAYDFSAGVDGITATAATVDGNVDSISDDNGISKNNTLRLTGDATTASHFAGIPIGSLVASSAYRVTGWYLIPSSNTIIDQWSLNGTDPDVVFSQVGAWTYFEASVITRSSGDAYLLEMLDGEDSAVAADGELVYFAEIKISRATSQPVRFFRNPKTNQYQECFLVNEQITSVSRDLLYFRRTYAPEFADIVSYGSADFVRQDMSSLKSGTLYAATFDAKQTVTYSGRKEIQAVGSIDEVQVIASADVVVDPSGTLTFGSTTSVLTQSASDIQDDLVGESVTSIVKSGNKIVIYTSLGSLTSINIDIAGIASGETYALSLDGGVATIEFVKNRDVAGGTLTITNEDRISDFSSSADGFEAVGNYAQVLYAQTIGGRVDCLLCQRNSASFSSTGAASKIFNFSAGYSVDIYIPSGSALTGIGIYNESLALIDYTTTKGSWVTLSGSGTRVFVSHCDGSGVITIAPNLTPYYIDNVVFGFATLTTSLAQTAAQIASDISALDANVVKSGAKVEIYTGAVSLDDFSLDVTGLDSAIIDTITRTGADLVVEFTDTRSISETYTNQSAIRSLQVNSHEITDVGTRIPIFKGDELVSTTTVSVVTDANNIMVPLEDVPGADFQATHIGDPATATVYNLSVVRTPSRITSAFYIPGISSGITTPDDIPVIEGDESAANQLAAIANADTYLQVRSSDLEQLLQSLYVRTVEEVKRENVFS